MVVLRFKIVGKNSSFIIYHFHSSLISMNIAILSRGPGLYSTQSLLRSGLSKGHRVRVLDHMRCNIVIEKDCPIIYYGNEVLTNVDAIIPRIGASVTFYGAAIVRQFELMGVYSATSSDGLLRSRDKLRCLQLLSTGGLGMPKTVFSDHTGSAEDLVRAVGGCPVVIKVLSGTHGMGVVLAGEKQAAVSMIDAFNSLKERVLVQEFISESKGTDIRAFVVDGEVVAAMKRRAQPGEFRSNLHQGGTAIGIKLSAEEEKTALAAARILGLKVAGVDMLPSDRGPLILEVNPSPGLEGITKTTGVNVAARIIESIEKELEPHRFKSSGYDFLD
jgi:ribosomal protein S6--L-glutamate ligase